MITKEEQEKQTELFKKHKVFFAFSQEQLERGKKENNIEEGTKLASLGAGLILPVANVDAFVEEHNALFKSHM